MDGDTDVSDRQFLTFQVAGEEYALGVLRVREILEYGVVTRVPLTPPWIRGVFNLRGGVVPVVDLAVKFGVPRGETTPRTCIVIVEASLGGEAALMGLVADAVNQVLELRPEDIEAPPTFGTRVRIDYLLGVAKAEKRFVLLLDIDRVLSSDELLTLAETADQEDGLEAAFSDRPAEASAPAAG
jgi:purine-binding chemotaxis protein CheW